MSDNSISRSFNNLSPGYGVTLGHAMRRVLISSIKGFGLIGVKITGVNHIFSSVRGVQEDIEHIIINLKKIIFKSDLDSFLMSVSSNGGVITADMFKIVKQREGYFFDALQSENVEEVESEDSSAVKILNGDQHICTVSKDVEFSIEIAVQSGVGYLSSDDVEVPQGFIKLDVGFSPIKRVSYNVEDIRVGQRTDYNKLTLSVETDGSVDPDDVINESIDILVNQLEGLKNQSAKVDYEVEDKSIVDPRWNDEISVLQLSRRAQNVVSHLGFVYIGDLITATEQDLFAVPGCGSNTLKDIETALESKYGFKLNMKIDNWSEIRPKGMVL